MTPTSPNNRFPNFIDNKEGRVHRTPPIARRNNTPEQQSTVLLEVFLRSTPNVAQRTPLSSQGKKPSDHSSSPDYASPTSTSEHATPASKSERNTTGTPSTSDARMQTPAASSPSKSARLTSEQSRPSQNPSQETFLVLLSADTSNFPSTPTFPLVPATRSHLPGRAREYPSGSPVFYTQVDSNSSSSDND